MGSIKKPFFNDMHCTKDSKRRRLKLVCLKFYLVNTPSVERDIAYWAFLCHAQMFFIVLFTVL